MPVRLGPNRAVVDRAVPCAMLILGSRGNSSRFAGSAEAISSSRSVIAIGDATSAPLVATRLIILPLRILHASCFLIEQTHPLRSNVIDQKEFEQLLPLACEWALAQEQIILASGASLGPPHIADAQRAGVQDCSRIRVLVVDRIPMPDDKQLAEAARRFQIITAATRGVAFGYGIIIRADCWGDRELLAHQLVHVAQYERNHDLDSCIQEYLSERHTCADFTIGSLEEEARRVAREICATAPVAK